MEEVWEEGRTGTNKQKKVSIQEERQGPGRIYNREIRIKKIKKMKRWEKNCSTERESKKENIKKEAKKNE